MNDVERAVQGWKDAFVYCLMEHKVATLASGPCDDCVKMFAQAVDTGPGL